MMFKELIEFIREQYQTSEPIPLHAPVFMGREREMVLDAIDSTYVSSVGAYVTRFEQEIAEYTGSPGAVVTVNGTSALHMALLLAGVKPGDYVITQSLTFVATCNAITYCQADPILLDVDRETLGLSPKAMQAWLDENAFRDDEGLCRYKANNRIIRACVPMHTFGHPADLDGLLAVANQWGLTLVEDAAESLGSLYKGRHTGTYGSLGVLSFNGNKIITTGGGGMILCDEALAKRAKHLTTTAKLPHAYEFVHDEVGFNYRMPNLNAALGCAQLEKIDFYIASKRRFAQSYQTFFKGTQFDFITEPYGAKSNYWLNAFICENEHVRDLALTTMNKAGVLVRPVWRNMANLNMYSGALKDSLAVSTWLSQRIVNLPSSVVPSALSVFGELQ